MGTITLSGAWPGHTEVVEYGDRRLRVTLSRDNDHGAPWKENDGHGVVVRLGDLPASLPDDLSDVEATVEAAANGYAVTDEDVAAAALFRKLTIADSRSRLDALWYDVLRTLQKAQREGWGPGQKWLDAHPDATPQEKLMAAVEADYDYLKGWYDDDWCYLVVEVELLDDDDEVVESSVLGGVENSDDEYVEEIVTELADELLASHTGAAHEQQAQQPQQIAA